MRAAICWGFCWAATFLSSGVLAQTPEGAPTATTATATPTPTPTPTTTPTTTTTPSCPCPPPPRHDGFYFRVSSGFAYSSVFGDGPNGSASVSGLGSLASLAIGGTLAPGIVLAGTLGGGTTTHKFQGGPFANATIAGGSGPPAMVQASGDGSASLFEVGVLLDWFPDPTKGLHLGGSVGLGGAAITNQADGSKMAGIGAAGALFFGQDWWIGTGWSLGVEGVATGATPREQIKDSSGTDTGYRLTPLALGVEISLLYY